MENFSDISKKKQEIEEIAFLFVEEGIDKNKFIAKNELEADLFLEAYNKYKNGNALEEEDREVKLAA